MRLLIVGAGATGSVLAARLSRAGAEVVLVGRGPQADALRQSGLTVEGLTQGHFRLRTANSPAIGVPVDAVVLAVKSPELEAAAKQISGAVEPPVPLLALQNGLGIDDRLRSALEQGGWTDAAHVLVRGVTSLGATLVSPGRGRHAGVGVFVLPDSAGVRNAASTFWAELLQRAGFRVRRVPDIHREVWRKLLVNAAINPVTADHGIPNGQLAEEPWRGQALALLREAVTVARAEGFDFSELDADRELWRVVRATSSNRSSMLQDLDRGRPTEVQAISGEIVRRAARHGIGEPATERALSRQRPRAARGRAGPG